MKKRIRLICIIIALCLGINCFMIIPSYAYEYDLNQKSRVQLPSYKTVKSAPKPAVRIARTVPFLLVPESTILPDNQESLWYNKKLPLKKEHQKVLWDYCKSRKLDYFDMLALIYTESNFNEKCSTGSNKGYFQIGKVHFSSLSKTLKTPNKPLDGTININWGTAMYSWILSDKRVKNLTGKKKRDVALSIFQRGTGGYDKHGISSKFLKVFYKKRDIVCSYFKK